MKVLHVVASAQRRGAEVFASDLVGAHTGCEQRVAVLRASDGPTVAFDAPIELLGADGGSGPVSLPAARSLRRLIRGWRPDVVLAHGGEPLKYAVLARWSGGPPLVYRRIGSAHGYADRRAARLAYAALIKRARMTVAVAETVREDTIRTFRVDPARVVTIPNAVDVARLAATPREEVRRALGLDPRARVILSAGALTWEKDPLGVLDVAARAMADRPDAIVLFAGDGPLRADLEAAVRAHGLRDRALLLGSREDIPELLGAADLLLLASATEGMPAVLIEAGIGGVPVASFDIGGIGEIVIDGETGVLTPAGDAGALAGRVGELLDDPAMRDQMGRAARARCSERFDIGTVAAMYEQLYEDVVARRPVDVMVR